MAKRQLRIKITDEHGLNAVPMLTYVSLVLKNNSVLFVKLLKFEGNILLAQDAILREHQIALSDIQEIILEKHA